jgi:hypothetical protein
MSIKIDSLQMLRCADWQKLTGVSEVLTASITRAIALMVHL